jgi:hypothetical protein
MKEEHQQIIIEKIAKSLNIPDSAYEKASARYKSLGEWFGREESACGNFDPHIYPQGSFRLGTVVRGDSYDLDFGCRLRQGVTKETHTQQELKKLVGSDMEAYRKANGVQNELAEKHRCWRLEYADELKFHMDGVPSIPELEERRRHLKEAMIKSGRESMLAESVTAFAGAITDNRLPNYARIDPDWRVSNSEGYALWFEHRMRRGMTGAQERVFLEKRALAQVDNLPNVQRAATPLQQSIQLLKRHRDIMFSDNADSKPISIILTTLAGWGYEGETDLVQTIQGILARMETFVRRESPRVSNPVNPQEDFADKWADPKYAPLHLEDSFWSWLRQAQNDLDLILTSSDPSFITEQVVECFGSRIDEGDLASRIGRPSHIHIPKKVSVSSKPAKPWLWD